MRAADGTLPKVDDHAYAVCIKEHIVGLHVAVQKTLSGNGFFGLLTGSTDWNSPVNVFQTSQYVLHHTRYVSFGDDLKIPPQLLHCVQQVPGADELRDSVHGVVLVVDLLHAGRILKRPIIEKRVSPKKPHDSSGIWRS